VRPYFCEDEKSKKPKNAEPKRPPLADNVIAEWLAKRTPAQNKKLHKIILGATKLAGYNQCRECGPVCEKCKREVLEDLIAHEVDLDFIEIKD
jgi:hypothetical protein